jgi:hypothetical protein
VAPVLFVIATAVIALWVDVRFPDLAPGDLMRTGIHLSVAFLVSTVVAPFASDLVIDTGLPLARLAGLLLVLAGLAYVFLTVIWVIKLFQGRLGSITR